MNIYCNQGGVSKLTISKTFYSKNIPKVDSGFSLTNRTRTINYFVVWEDELISETDGSIVDQGSAKGSQNERVETDDRFDNLKSKTKPNETQDSANRKVQQIVAEIIFLVCHSTDTSV